MIVKRNKNLSGITNEVVDRRIAKTDVPIVSMDAHNQVMSEGQRRLSLQICISFEIETPRVIMVLHESSALLAQAFENRTRELKEKEWERERETSLRWNFPFNPIEKEKEMVFMCSCSMFKPHSQLARCPANVSKEWRNTWTRFSLLSFLSQSPPTRTHTWIFPKHRRSSVQASMTRFHSIHQRKLVKSTFHSYGRQSSFKCTQISDESPKCPDIAIWD